MSYSTKEVPEKPYEFPPPPLFVAWVEEGTYDHVNGNYIPDGKGAGQIRHLPTLEKARKRVRDYCLWGGGGKFNRDWSIYKWDGTEYVLLYSGREGEEKDSNMLFDGKTKISDLYEPETDTSAYDDALQAALTSIASAAT